MNAKLSASHFEKAKHAACDRITKNYYHDFSLISIKIDISKFLSMLLSVTELL